MRRVVEVDTVSCLVVLAKGRHLGFAPDNRAAHRKETLGNRPPVSAMSRRASNGLLFGAPGQPQYDNTSACGTPTIDIGHAVQTVGWTDPANFRTAWDVMNVYWSYDWYCVYLVGGDHTAYWLTTTGWSLLGFYTSVTYSYYHDYLTAWGYSFYQNTGFILCSGTVNANVRRNQAIATSDGQSYFDYDADISGPACTILLGLFIDQSRT
jgi:hypothetical protein